MLICCTGVIIRGAFKKSAEKCCHFFLFRGEKVQVGNDQEKAQSERDFHSKNRGGKKLNRQSSTYTMKTYRKPNEQLFSQ